MVGTLHFPTEVTPMGSLPGAMPVIAVTVSEYALPGDAEDAASAYFGRPVRFVGLLHRAQSGLYAGTDTSVWQVL